VSGAGISAGRYRQKKGIDTVPSHWLTSAHPGMGNDLIQ
jgi:hypothetical protein